MKSLPFARAGAAMTLSLVLALAACGTQSAKTASAATITLTGKGCSPASVTVPKTGTVTLTVKNSSTSTAELEILDGNQVVSEQENLAPGFSKDFSAGLAAKQYSLVCGDKDQPRGTLVVAGGTGATASSTPASTAASGPSTTVTVKLEEYSVTPTPKSAPAGHVVFRIENTGTATHEFVVLKTDIGAKQVPMKDGAVDEHAAGVTKVKEGDDVGSGDTTSLATDLEPGAYLLICNIPGHAMAGMIAPFKVTAPSAPAS